MQRILLPLLLGAVLARAVLVDPPNATDAMLTVEPAHPSINISFIKEVTLTVSPPDVALTPHEEQEVSSFLESGLRLLDPIMRFFESLTSPPEPAQHV